MKKCFSKMFTLFVATVLGISSGYVFSAEKGQNMSREELVQARIEQMESWNKPVLFFGKVVDQFEKPVVGAAVVADIAKMDPENPNPVSWGVSVKEFRVTTDGYGLFELKGQGIDLGPHKERTSYTIRKAKVSSKDTKETQASIDVAIGMNLATFVQTCHFGQGRAMSYAGLTAKDQKALLEQVLPMEEIDEWTRYSAAMGKLLKAQKEGTAAIDITAQAVLSERQLGLTVLKSDSETWSRTNLEKLTDLKHQKNIAENGLIDQKERLQWTKDQLDEIDMDTLAAEQIVLEASVVEAEEAHLATAMTLRGAQEVYALWEKKEYNLQKEIDALRESLACPTCERGYGPEQESLIAVKIESLERDRAAAMQNMGDSAE